MGDVFTLVCLWPAELSIKRLAYGTYAIPKYL